MSQVQLVKQFLLKIWLGLSGRPSRFLCDTCKYNYGSACHRPERPNARYCPDYRRGR
ncbi:MAG TPA: hypothetical protein VF234_00925 [Limnochordia bacterium]